jgi:hypothetical protein
MAYSKEIYNGVADAIEALSRKYPEYGFFFGYMDNEEYINKKVVVVRTYHIFSDVEIVPLDLQVKSRGFSIYKVDEMLEWVDSLSDLWVNMYAKPLLDYRISFFSDDKRREQYEQSTGIGNAIDMFTEK